MLYLQDRTHPQSSFCRSHQDKELWLGASNARDTTPCCFRTAATPPWWLMSRLRNVDIHFPLTKGTNLLTESISTPCSDSQSGFMTSTHGHISGQGRLQSIWAVFSKVCPGMMVTQDAFAADPGVRLTA